MTAGATVTAPCFTAEEAQEWSSANAGLWSPATSPCVDCTPAFRRQEKAAGRCNRTAQPVAPVLSPTITEKHCSGCGETKPLDAFARDRCRSDGRQRLCRDCGKVRYARWYAARKARAA